jgi:hypothetical protein
MHDGILRISDLFEAGNSAWKNQNLYITSDEEIKEGDYIVQINSEKTNINIINCQSEAQTKIANIKEGNFTKNKIILTTDQDLIDDNVQAINDEFLDWFCKNPSCEEVETEFFAKFSNDLYRIIIPKEESMSYEEFRENASNDLIIKFDKDCSRYSEDGNSDNYFYANCKYWESKIEESKQNALNHFLSTSDVIIKDSQKFDY